LTLATTGIMFAASFRGIGLISDGDEWVFGFDDGTSVSIKDPMITNIQFNMSQFNDELSGTIDFVAQPHYYSSSPPQDKRLAVDMSIGELLEMVRDKVQERR